MSTFLNKTKDAYFWLIAWIDDHPQQSFWIAATLIVAGLFV